MNSISQSFENMNLNDVTNIIREQILRKLISGPFLLYKDMDFMIILDIQEDIKYNITSLNEYIFKTLHLYHEEIIKFDLTTMNDIEMILIENSSKDMYNGYYSKLLYKCIVHINDYYSKYYNSQTGDILKTMFSIMNNNLDTARRVNNNDEYIKHNKFDVVFRQINEIYYNLLPFNLYIKKLLKELKSKDSGLTLSNKLDDEIKMIESEFNKINIFNKYENETNYFHYFANNLINVEKNYDNTIRISKLLISISDRIMKLIVQSKLQATPILKKNTKQIISRQRFLIRATKRFNQLHKSHIKAHVDIIEAIESDYFKIQLMQNIDYSYLNNIL